MTFFAEFAGIGNLFVSIGISELLSAVFIWEWGGCLFLFFSGYSLFW